MSTAVKRARLHDSEGAGDGERMDGRTEGTAGTSNSALATVGALDGTKDATRKGTSLTQRVPRRRTPDAAHTRQTAQRPDRP